MFEVKIYIETSLQGPCTKKGYHLALVEYMKKNGEPETREVLGVENETTFHRSSLLAAVEALRILTKQCQVTIYTYCPYLQNSVERGNLEEWAKKNWKKTSGEEIKHKDLWQEFMRFTDLHEITFRFSKHHEYRSYMQSEIAEKQKKDAKNKDT